MEKSPTNSSPSPSSSFSTRKMSPTPVPISDPANHLQRAKIKSYSQPLGRDLVTNSHLDNRCFSYPHYPQKPNPNPNVNDATLLEFTGMGGGAGIFKLPVRSPMLLGHPPPVEIRPHPLRETQVGSFLRVIACTESQLWAGQENGVRCWEIGRVFGGCAGGGRSGDEESAPFRESGRTSPTMCMVVDGRRGLVWTGHKDGKVRSWRVEAEGGEAEGEVGTGTGFKEGLSWHAHRGSVLSMALTSYGNYVYVQHIVAVIT